MNRLTIRWDNEVAAEVLRQLQGSGSGLSDCLNAAKVARQALQEARPDEKDQMMNALVAEFEAVVTALEESGRSIETLISDTQAARERFETAASDVDRMIDQLMPSAAPGIGGGLSGRAQAPVSQIDWKVYKPIIQIDMRSRTDAVVPNWLESQLNDNELFRDWM